MHVIIILLLCFLLIIIDRFMRSVISKDSKHSKISKDNSKLQRYTFREYLIPVDSQQTSTIKASRHKQKDINPKIIMALADQTYDYRQTNVLKIISNFYRNRNIMIRPDNYALLLWDLLIVIIVIYYLLEIGMIIGFQQDFWRDELNNVLGLQIFFIIVLTIDILMSPIKAYYQEGLLITNVEQILKNYLQCEFWIDISALIMIIAPLISQNIYVNVIKIFWFAKIYTTSRINLEYERLTQLNIFHSTAYLVVKLIVYCYFYAHYMGIGFYLTSLWVFNNNYYGPNTPNICWIYKAWAFYQLEITLLWPAKYCYIMYYSIAVVTTIAYGDITPLNPIEVIYTIFALLVVTIIFGYIMTEILRLLINIFTYNQDRRLANFSFNEMLKAQMVKQSIQEQIKAQNQYLDREERYRKREIQDRILTFLPNEPLYRLLLGLYNDFLIELGFAFISQPQYTNFDIIHHNCLFLQPIIKDIKEERRFIGDIIYNENETEDHHKAYFYTKKTYQNAVLIGFGNTPKLKSGKLDVTHNIMNKSFEIKRIQKMFGHIQFFTGQNRSHWAICMQNCLLFVVSRAILLKCYYLLTNEQKQIVFSRIESIESESCLICSEPHHFVICPYVFYNRQYSIKVDTYTPRIDSQKLKNKRNRQNTQHTYKIFTTIKDYKAIITKQYKDKLMMNKASHQLFLSLQLDQDQNHEEEYYFQNELLETQMMVQEMYKNSLEDIGILPFQHECDEVRNYKYYKPDGNSNVIQSKYQKLPRKYKKSFNRISNLTSKTQKR